MGNDHDDIHALRRELTELRGRLATLEAKGAVPFEPALDTSSEQAPEPVGRRQLLRNMGGIAAGAAGATVVAGLLAAEPAAAAVQYVRLDTVTPGNATTEIRASGATSMDPLFLLSHDGAGTAMRAAAANGTAIEAMSIASPAVHATSQNANALVGETDSGDGASGTSNSGRGVSGQSTSGAGVAASSDSAEGLVAASISGPRVDASSDTGDGAVVTSSSGRALVVGGTGRLALTGTTAAGAAGPPSTGAFATGEIVRDEAGTFWCCVAGGSPGTWRRFAAADSVGAMTVLPVPVRVYDSRLIAAALLGSRRVSVSKVGAGLPNSGASSGVPSGATAVFANVTVTETSSSGWLAVWTGDAEWPGHSNVNWTSADATIANSAVTAISGTGEISLLTSATAQVIVDVFGYWR